MVGGPSSQFRIHNKTSYNSHTPSFQTLYVPVIRLIISSFLSLAPPHIPTGHDPIHVTPRAPFTWLTHLIRYMIWVKSASIYAWTQFTRASIPHFWKTIQAPWVGSKEVLEVSHVTSPDNHRWCPAVIRKQFWMISLYALEYFKSTSIMLTTC